MRKEEKEDVFRQAHDCSIRNKQQLEQSKICGCFSCCEIFPPSEITDYISDEEPTAECPYCHIDAVIGDASGFPITEEFLRKMMYRWFWSGADRNVSVIKETTNIIITLRRGRSALPLS